VNVDEDGAVVSVNGTAEGQSPLPGNLYLAPGAHTIVARKEGREASVQITAVAGQSSSTNLRFKKANAVEAAAAEKTEKPSEAREKPAKAAPPEEEQAPSKPEPAEKPAEAAAPASPGSGHHRIGFFEWAANSPVAWVGGGLTAVGIGGGIGFAVGAKRNYDNADSIAAQITKATIADNLLKEGACTEARFSMLSLQRASEYRVACGKYKDYVANGDTMKTLSIVGWIVAGAAAVGTGVLYAVDGFAPNDAAKAREPRRATAVVGPWLTGTERGLFVMGQF
jgi:hypothetical protein